MGTESKTFDKFGQWNDAYRPSSEALVAENDATHLKEQKLEIRKFKARAYLRIISSHPRNSGVSTSLKTLSPRWASSSGFGQSLELFKMTSGPNTNGLLAKDQQSQIRLERSSQWVKTRAFQLKNCWRSEAAGHLEQDCQKPAFGNRKMTLKPKRRNSKLGLTATPKAFKGSLKQAHLDRLTIFSKLSDKN